MNDKISICIYDDITKINKNFPAGKEKYYFPMSKCIKLLAFIDCQYDFPYTMSDTDNDILHPDYEGVLTVQGMMINPEYQVICEMLNAQSSLSGLFKRIRNSEHYWLIKHLVLAADSKNNSVMDISKNYGLSGTHFRRLCQRYIGHQSKYQLRHWRGVASVLDVLVKEHSLTRIASDHGYCSASHFSNEIRQQFGMSPKKIRDLHHAIKK
ncbi:helix-turn-helix domain-containing protein [Morganella psychrotolerans]|uniref:Helix-turn-helix domain-containing protein n=2 Tax=Morganella psychrotolerans TaxID=368603 RepID=A0A5M9R433_9GAMM|nr:helix-turn-helix domain-containing protein [Morganella psychrotolerans]